MNWYYVEQGQQAGPVDDTQLEELFRSGRIQSETLIWREGMANWAAYNEAKGAAAQSGLRLAASTAAAPAEETVEAVCAECGGIFPKQNMIRYGEAYVCAACKPVFMQKLAEGARLGNAHGAFQYATFWTRFAAVFLDGLILWAVNFVMSLVAGVGVGVTARNAPGAALGLQLGLTAIQLAIALGYETFMIGKYGATLGKMACKIRVVTADGGKVTYLRALGRYFAKILSGCPTLMIGFIIAGFDEQKRALHDRICNTRVILK